MFIFLLYLVLTLDQNEYLTGLIAVLALLFLNCLKIKICFSKYSLFFIISLIYTFILNIPVIFNIPVTLTTAYLFLFLPYLFDYNFKNNTKLLLSPLLLIYILIFFQLITFFEIIDYNFVNNLIAGPGREMYDYTGQPYSARRAYGLFGNPNYAGFVIILIYYLCLQLKNKPGLLSHLFVLCGLVTTGSRAVMLSFFIIIFFNFFKKNFKISSIFFFIFFLFTSVVFIKIFDLRVLDFKNLSQDQSFVVRVKHLLTYSSALYQDNELLKFLFGNGIRDNLTYYFDGDLGNLFYSLGILGMISFFLLIHHKLKKINSDDIFYALLPIFFAGGIFGNYKTLFFFIFFPALIEFFRSLKK